MLEEVLTWCEAFNAASDDRMNQLWEFFCSLEPLLLFVLNGICWIFFVCALLSLAVFIVVCILAFVVWIVVDIIKLIEKFCERWKKEESED